MSDGEVIKGILRIRTGKKGASYQVELPTKKGTNAFHIALAAKAFKDTDATEGMEVDVVRGPNGQPQKVTIPGADEAATTTREEAMRSSGPAARGGHRGGKPAARGGPARTDATAPYNFVPTIPTRIASGFSPPRPGDGTVTGRIRCSLVALTPLIVGGADSGAPAGERSEPRLIEWCEASGRPVIPGTSLKGCLRHVIESLSFSSLWPTSETTLAARDVSNPRSNYHQRLRQAGGVKAGWMVRSGPRWTLKTCEFGSARITDLLRAVEVPPRFAEKSGDEKTREWRRNGGRTVSFDLEQIQTQDGDTRSEAVRIGSGSLEGWPVFSGHIQKKVRDTVFLAPASHDLEVDDSVWNDFQDQMTDAQEKLWKEREEAGRQSGLPGIPVFWLPTDSSGQAVDAIGLTRFLRLPVRRQPRDLAPKVSNDFAAVLFGHVDHDGGQSARRGRAWFGAGQLVGEDQRQAPTAPVVAGQPKPSAVNMYLTQDETSVRTFGNYDTNENLTDYDSEAARLRGRKHYWHRDVHFPPPPNANVKVQCRYQPLPAGVRFEFEVFLDGVSRGEAGGVIHALDLPEGHAHRLGGGKPFGLGSVRINIESIQLSEDRVRSSSLADRANASTEIDAKDLKSAFESIIGDKVGFASDAYEQQREVKAFRRLADRDNRPANANTASMELNDRNGGPSYKTKPLLKEPTAIS